MSRRQPGAREKSPESRTDQCLDAADWHPLSPPRCIVYTDADLDAWPGEAGNAVLKKLPAGSVQLYINDFNIPINVIYLINRY